ncbi:hypothetical protein DFH11DRAFT_1518196, partial [Phellopilus nigrolimitatus]
VLHPGYKTIYFEKQGWPSEWIETAKQVLKDEWDDNYRPVEESHVEAEDNVRWP